MSYSFIQKWYHSRLFWGMFFIDIMSKNYAQTLPYNRSINILPFMSLRLHYNTGVSWGLLNTLPGKEYIIPLLMVGVMVLMVRYTSERQRDGHSVLGETLILAGGFGNIINRLGTSYVTDFIYIHYGSYSFPIFNFADIFITVGAFIMLYNFLLGDDE